MPLSACCCCCVSGEPLDAPLLRRHDEGPGGTLGAPAPAVIERDGVIAHAPAPEPAGPKETRRTRGSISQLFGNSVPIARPLLRRASSIASDVSEASRVAAVKLQTAWRGFKDRETYRQALTSAWIITRKVSARFTAKVYRAEKERMQQERDDKFPSIQLCDPETAHRGELGELLGWTDAALAEMNALLVDGSADELVDAIEAEFLAARDQAAAAYSDDAGRRKKTSTRVRQAAALKKAREDLSNIHYVLRGSRAANVFTSKHLPPHIKLSFINKT